jgi:hypothetical protein
MLPGGFRLFMFIPKECEPPRDSYKENLEVLRELWSQDIGEETLVIRHHRTVLGTIHYTTVV